MKTFTTVSLLLTLMSNGWAQPVVQRSHLIVPGDEFFINTQQIVLDPGSSGENMTWDFSGIPQGPTTIRREVASADTTWAADVYTTANIAIILNQLFSIIQYHSLEDDIWEEIGTAALGSSSFIYTNPRTRLEFPLTYNSMWDDEFEYSWSQMGTRTIVGYGESEMIVDSYGSLILPHTTFEDVLRLKVIDHVIDTQPQPIDGHVRKRIYHDTSYIWISPSYHAPLCTYTRSHLEVIFSSPDTITSSIQQSSQFLYDPMSGSTGIQDIKPGTLLMSASPNPFTQTLTLTFNIERPQDGEFYLQDLRGNFLYYEAVSCQAGLNIVSFSLPNVQAGIYLALVRTSEGRDIQKVVCIASN